MLWTSLSSRYWTLSWNHIHRTMPAAAVVVAMAVVVVLTHRGTTPHAADAQGIVAAAIVGHSPK